ncbi:MAG: caspase family protein [Gemmataceae bacterium]
MPRSLRWLPVAVIATVAALASAQDADGKKYALLVGVKDYKGTDLQSLKYTENDVEELAGILRASGYRRVTLLTQSEAFSRKNDDFFPTADNVRDNLKAMLAERQPADTVFIAFAGHGVQLKEPAGMFFCPQKSDLADPRTLVALDDVYAALKECKAGTRLLVVDACRNDPMVGRSATVANLASATRPELPKPPGGVAALFSCSAGERAFESDKHKHGIFFHHLIEGMKGKAAGKNGEVDLLGLAQHVMAEVPETTRDEFGLKASQRPHLLSDAQRVTLVRVSAAAVKPQPAADTAPPAVVESAKAAATESDGPKRLAPVRASTETVLLDNCTMAFGLNVGDLANVSPTMKHAVDQMNASWLHANGLTNVKRIYGSMVRTSDGMYRFLAAMECDFDSDAYLSSNPTARVIDRRYGIISDVQNNTPTLYAALPGVGLLTTGADSLPQMQAHLARLHAGKPVTMNPEFRASYSATDKSKTLWLVAELTAGPNDQPQMQAAAAVASALSAAVQLTPQPALRVALKLKNGIDATRAAKGIQQEADGMLNVLWNATLQSGNPQMQLLILPLIRSRNYRLEGREVVLTAGIDAASWRQLTQGQ